LLKGIYERRWNMNRLTLILSIVITALVVFIGTAILAQDNYEGHDAAYWYEKGSASEELRAANFQAITCIRGLAYINLPDLGDYYIYDSTFATDDAGNYYPKHDVDSCLYGL
jgi:hypothetical protein